MTIEIRKLIIEAHVNTADDSNTSCSSKNTNPTILNTSVSGIDRVKQDQISQVLSTLKQKEEQWPF